LQFTQTDFTNEWLLVGGGGVIVLRMVRDFTFDEKQIGHGDPRKIGKLKNVDVYFSSKLPGNEFCAGCGVRYARGLLRDLPYHINNAINNDPPAHPPGGLPANMAQFPELVVVVAADTADQAPIPGPRDVRPPCEGGPPYPRQALQGVADVMDRDFLDELARQPKPKHSIRERIAATPAMVLALVMLISMLSYLLFAWLTAQAIK